MNKYPVLFLNITVYLLKYIASVFFYTPVVFFWLYVLFSVSDAAELSAPGYLPELCVAAGHLTLSALWIADLLVFAEKHLKHTFYFRSNPAETAALLVISVTVAAVNTFFPLSDALSLFSGVLR